MKEKEEIKDQEPLTESVLDADSESVDDFIRQLEEKEKDLHITLDGTVIEIEAGFDDGNPSVFFADQAPRPEPVKQVIPEPIVASPEPEESESSDDELAELAERVDDLEEFNAALKENVRRLEAERAEILENSLRRNRDFETYKTRNERDRSDHLRDQTVALVERLLPGLDNLRRALDSAEKLVHERSSEFAHFYEGIQMVNEQFIVALKEMGIESIPAKGDEFDPHLHEAVATVETEELANNIVCEELLRGFRLGDRIIRHSLVKVAVNGQMPDDDPKTAEEETIETENDSQ